MLTGRNIVVTGGAGLIGSHFCSAILEQNGVLIVADIDDARAAPLVWRLRSQHGESRVLFQQLDISSKESQQQLIDNVTKRCGTIHGVVCNAYPRNRNYGRKFEDVELKDFNENVSLHLGGYFLTAQVYAEYFKKVGGGNIVFTSSIYGIIPPRFDIYEGTTMTMPVEYATIKAGIIHLAKYIAKYYKGAGIRANILSPGGILDNQPENFVRRYNAYSLSKGMLVPDDLRGTLVFLLSNASEYVNGQNIVVDDGFSL